MTKPIGGIPMRDSQFKFLSSTSRGKGNLNFTTEEVIFAALHHDLGKVGDMENDYYIPQESEWHRKNRGEIFTHNGALQYMTVTDRAIFLLNQFQIFHHLPQLHLVKIS